MILWPQPDGSVLGTPQPAHALIAGELMRHITPRPQPVAPVVNAASQHDCAWLPWEAAPEFDRSTGLPRSFNAVPGHAHVPMWERGVATALANWGLWEALLILRHGTHIYGIASRTAASPESRAAMDRYAAHEREQGAAWMQRLGVTEADVAPLSHALAIVDGIALALCWGQASFDCAGIRLTRTAPFAATLAPWPLDIPAQEIETTALRLPARFADEAAMRDGLRDAARLPLRFALSPA